MRRLGEVMQKQKSLEEKATQGWTALGKLITQGLKKLEEKRKEKWKEASGVAEVKTKARSKKGRKVQKHRKSKKKGGKRGKRRRRR